MKSFTGLFLIFFFLFVLSLNSTHCFDFLASPLNCNSLAYLWQISITDLTQSILKTKTPEFEYYFSILILGQKKLVDYAAKESFKNVGLYHLLVVSGFHISMFGGILYCCISFIFRPLIYFQLIAQIHTKYLDAMLRFSAVSMVFLFALLSGFGASAQRAFLFFAIWHWERYLFGRNHLLLRLSTAGFFQFIFFPKYFFSLANLMSWLASGCFIVFGCIMKQDYRIAIVVLFFLDGLAYYFFGNYSGVSFITTPLLCPLYIVVFVANLIAVLPMVPQFFGLFAVNLTQIFWELVHTSAGIRSVWLGYLPWINVKIIFITTFFSGAYLLALLLKKADTT